MENVTPKRGRRLGTDVGIPTNPVQMPKTGEQNLVEPQQQAEEATWQTYRSSTAHAEPPGQLDRRGVRKQNSSGLKRPGRNRVKPSRNRATQLRESTDKDE